MKSLSIVTCVTGLAAMLAAVPASAGDSSGGRPHLHVDDSHDSCFFDLHPELTKAEWEEFAEEVGSILRFRQLGDATTLGKGRVELSLQYTGSSIDDAKGAWNNTMSHPTADHYLGGSIAFPRVVARLGVSDRVDVGAWGGLNPDANYGFVGLDTRIALLKQDDGRPVSVSIRPSVTAMVGPAEVSAANASIDITASRAIGAFSPYAGVGTTASGAFERSDEVDFDPADHGGSLAYAGVAYRWRSLVLSAEIEKAALFSYGFRIGTRF